MNSLEELLGKISIYGEARAFHENFNSGDNDAQKRAMGLLDNLAKAPVDYTDQKSINLGVDDVTTRFEQESVGYFGEYRSEINNLLLRTQSKKLDKMVLNVVPVERDGEDEHNRRVKLHARASQLQQMIQGLRSDKIKYDSIQPELIKYIKAEVDSIAKPEVDPSSKYLNKDYVKIVENFLLYAVRDERFGVQVLNGMAINAIKSFDNSFRGSESEKSRKRAQYALDNVNALYDEGDKNSIMALQVLNSVLQAK